MADTQPAREERPDRQFLRPAVPPYLRSHSASTVHSTASSRSNRPHPQNEYHTTTANLTNVLGTAEPAFDPDFETRLGDGDRDDDEYDGGDGGDDDSDEEVDWDEIREQALNSKSKWRRPRPAWVYPFLGFTACSLGMSTAPKAELFINLTCLVHPPRQPSSVAVDNIAYAYEDHAAGMMYYDAPVNASLPSPVPTMPNDPTIGGPMPKSAADKWFLKLQKEIYQWHLAHPDPSDSGHHSPSGTPSTSTRVLPTGPLPQPTMPAGTPQVPESPRTDDPHPSTDQPPFRAIDPALCKKDPGVQAAAAKLTMALSVVSGILTSLSTGFWGKMSDTIGRKKIMAIIELGLLVNGVCFILVATFPHLAPGGYRSLVIGPIVEGSLGGTACLIATVNAYVSDLTPDGSRAGAFSRLMGILMSGFALGPLLGALVISATDNIMVPFYIDAVVHAAWPILILLLLPESLSKQARIHLAKRSSKAAEAARRKEALQREWEDDEPTEPPTAGSWRRMSHSGHSRRRKRITGNISRLFKRLFHFLEPLTVFAPQERTDGGKGRNWNLALVAFAVFSASMNYGVLAIKAQYTFYAYNWTTTQLGPYLSLVGFSRGFVLIALLPLAMRFLQSRFAKPPPVDASAAESQPVGPPTISTTRLDLITVRCSLLIELTGLALLGSNLPAVTFVIVSVALTLGTGTTPGLNSLALSLLPDKGSTGRLFGALSVLHAIGTGLLSPIVFGELFAATVGWYAPFDFLVAACLPALSLIALSFVKLKREPKPEPRGEDGRLLKKGSKAKIRSASIRE